jgi:hypothetical protein
MNNFRLALGLLVSTGLLYGQSATTGTLQGVVIDAAGAGVPEASITLRQLSSSAIRTLTTGDAGQFQAAGVAIGSYSLHIEKSGFNPVNVEELTISVGQTITQRITMSPASVTTRLDVQDQADFLQSSATTANVALGGERIEDAPASNRNYLNFVLAAPAVSASAGTNTSRSMAGLRNPSNDSGFVFNGLRGRNNSISIDGVDNRDETTGGNRVAVGLEMIQEFRVSGTSVSAEFGGAAGGLVNIVTHTGQNIWHGDATFFMQNEGLNARNPEVELGARPLTRKYQPGTSAGGPIKRDRTFFFFAFEQSWENAQEWSDAPRRYASVINSALAGSAFAGAGVHTLLPGLFSSAENDTEFSIKGTHLVNSSNTLTARYAFSRGKVRNDVQSGDNFTDQSARGSSLTADHSIVAGWSSVISPTKINDLRVQWSQRRASLTPSAEGPMYEIPGVVTLGESYRLDQQRTERHAEVVETFQWTAGKHLFSVGASVHGVFFDSRLANMFHGIYVFPTLNDFLAGRPDVAIQAFGNPQTNLTTVPVGVWFQDHWQLTPGLTIEAGLRYDRQWLPSAIPETNRNIAPRLGVAWHPGGASSWVFRAGTGLFYDRYPLGFLNNALQLNGVQGFEQYLVGAQAAQAFTLFRGGSFLQRLPGVQPSIYRAAPGFLSTYSRKLTAGVERKLDRDTTITAEYSNVRGIHLPRTRNVALTLPPQYDLEQTASSAYQGLALTLNRRLTKELTYLVSYNLSRTHDDASDYDEQPLNPSNLRQDWALSRQHQEHRITASGLFDLPVEDLKSAPGWLREGFDGITLAPIFTLGSGRPLNPLLTTDAYLTGAYPISARPEGFGRNSFLTPRTVSLDLRLMKTILIRHERARVQFGAEAFNLLNHTNRLRVSPYYTSTFGALVEAQNPRQVQLMFQIEY